MRKKLTRIGNSYGVIIDRSILELFGIKDYVELKVENGKLIITASQEKDQ